MPDVSDQLEDARSFAHRYCAEQGDPDATERLRIDLVGKSVIFSTIDAERCGSSISGILKPTRQEDTIRRALSRIMRQRERDRIIALAQDTQSAAWAMDIHSLAYAMLCRAGVNPLLLVSHRPRDGASISGFDLAMERSPLRANAEIRAGRVFVQSMTPEPDSGWDDAISYFEMESEGGRPCLMIRGMVLPDTACVALAGSTLQDVLRHPLTDSDEDLTFSTTIRHAVNADGNLLLHLEDERTTLAPLPDGLAASWLRFPWNP